MLAMAAFYSRVKRWVAASLPNTFTAPGIASMMVSWCRDTMLGTVVSWCRGITTSFLSFFFGRIGLSVFGVGEVDPFWVGCLGSGWLACGALFKFIRSP